MLYLGTKIKGKRMKKFTTALLTGSALLLFTACGSSGGSSSTPVEPAPPLYSTIQDLEFKTLNIKEIWKHDGSALYTTMKFTNNYADTSDGAPLLIDNTSSAYYVKGCSVATAGMVGPSGEELRYICLGKFRSGGMMGWALSINNGGIITGNFHFSSTGSTYELADGLISPSAAYAYLEGGVSDTVATTGSGILIASTDGVGSSSEVVQSSVDDDIDKEILYSNIVSQVSQTPATQQASPEIIQGFSEIHEALLRIESEK